MDVREHCPLRFPLPLNATGDNGDMVSKTNEVETLDSQYNYSNDCLPMTNEKKKRTPIGKRKTSFFGHRREARILSILNKKVF